MRFEEVKCSLATANLEVKQSILSVIYTCTLAPSVRTWLEDTKDTLKTFVHMIAGLRKPETLTNPLWWASFQTSDKLKSFRQFSS